MLDINRLIDTEMLNCTNFSEFANVVSWVSVTEEFQFVSHSESVKNILTQKTNLRALSSKVNTPETTGIFKKVIINALLLKEFSYLSSISIQNYVSGNESYISLDSKYQTIFLTSTTLADEKIKHEVFFQKLDSYKDTDINELYSLLKATQSK